MGNKFTICELTRDELAAFMATTHFNPAEIRGLWFHFKDLSCEDNSNVIDRRGFESAMMFRNSVLLNRIFAVFDADGDGLIDFSEFVHCLSTMSSKASHEEKLKLSFNVYDSNRDGKISIEELKETVLALMQEQDIVMSSTDADAVISRTLAELCPDGASSVSFEAYHDYVQKQPDILSNLTLNISNIIAEYAASHELVLSTPRDAALVEASGK